MKRRTGLSWLWFSLGIVYFFLPLFATFLFSLKGKKGVLSFAAYHNVFIDPQFLKTFGFSLEMALLTVIAGLALIVPTAIWIQLKLPKVKPIFDIFTLLPSLLAAFILLFGNAFGAYATAYALTGGLINIVPILIGAQIRGNVLHDANLGYALAFGMVIVMTISILAYTWLQKISSRWVK